MANIKFKDLFKLSGAGENQKKIAQIQAIASLIIFALIMAFLIKILMY